jgi:hypothetical protein
MPTVITPLYPAQKVSRVVDSVGQFWTEFIPPGGSVLGGIQQQAGSLTAMDFRDTTSMLAQGKDAPENLMARTVSCSRSGVNEYELHDHCRGSDTNTISAVRRAEDP